MEAQTFFEPLVTAPQSVATQSQAQSMPAQWLAVVIGGFSKFGQIIQLDEEPDDLLTVTPNRSFQTSHLLQHVFPGASLERCIASAIGRRATTTCLEEVASIFHEPEHECKCIRTTADQAPPSEIFRALERVVPNYDWQGGASKFGRCQYLMMLLRQVLDALDLNNPEFLTTVMRDRSAVAACACIANTEPDLELDPERIFGDWAAFHLIRRSLSDHSRPKDHPTAAGTTIVSGHATADEGTTTSSGFQHWTKPPPCEATGRAMQRGGTACKFLVAAG